MRRPLYRGVIAIAVALVAAVVLMAHTSKQKLYSEVVVTQAVVAGQPILATDLGSVLVASPPAAGVTTAEASVIGQLAEQNLYPGETLVASAYGKVFGSTPKGQVSVVIPVSAAQSAMVSPGQFVDILAVDSTTATSAPLATHVLVLNVFSASGNAVQTTGASGQAPGLVEVALTPATALTVVPQLSNSASFWLVLDPSHAL